MKSKTMKSKTMKSKSMKSKSMKKMKVKKVKKVSKIARGKHRRSAVFTGKKEKTAGGLTKDDFKKNADGKIVSKKSSEAAKKRYQSSGLKKWFKAVSAARKALKLKGMCPVGGKTDKGQALLKKT